MKPRSSTLEYRKRPGKWKYELTEDMVTLFPGMNFGHHEFHDQTGTLRAVVYEESWRIKAGYAIDGTSGIPDWFETDGTLTAAFWHDCAGQFRHLRCLQKHLSWSEWNALYADILRSQGERVKARIYWLGLTLFNRPFQIAGRLLGNKPSGDCPLHSYENGGRR